MKADPIKNAPEGGESAKAVFGRVRRFALPLAVLVTAGGGAAMLLAESVGTHSNSVEPVKAEPIRVLPVSSVRVRLEDAYTIEERFVGQVEAAQRSDIGFELPGTLVEVAVDEGEIVEAGQVLAELDTARLEARRDELEAAMAQAEAALELAESTFERFESALTKRSVSVQQVAEAREQRASAASAVRRIEAQLEAVEVDLEKSVLKAPFAGTISGRMADEGAIVNSGQPVLRILETGKLEIRAGLSQRAASEVEIGDRLEWESEHGDRVVAAVVRILPHRNDRTRTVDVIFSLEDNPGLRDGDLVGVPVRREIRKEGAWLPRGALTESARGLWAAYVLVLANVAEEPPGTGHLERRQLELLDEDENRVFVRGAIDEGERVVAAGLHRLSPGQRVRDAGIMAESLTRK